MATIHDNQQMRTITKFQCLKSACVGTTKNVISKYDWTEQNYSRAWKRLNAFYKDDYTQIQAFIRKLHKLPPMRSNISKVIRYVIDTVNRHIEGLSRHAKLDGKNVYAVFAVIDKIDTETYKAWEKYRPGLTKANANAGDDNENANNANLNRVEKKKYHHGPN